ncbi:REP-associated tyrosine transposase [Microcoleus vaginatus]|uniref:REP-associated tyrosine transposase n=1 Tax=Microcoleus vaginatus TaxID=119532 RepID=UPI001F60F25C
MIRENFSQGSNQDLGGEDAHATGQYQLFVGQASSLPLKLRKAQLKVTYRNLPHWELEGSVYFITFNTWEKLELTPAARQVVFNACKFFDRQRYQIFCLVVMPDHVHMLMQPLAKSDNKFWSLSSILHSMKSYSSKQIPKVMKHIGTVWQDERHDHIVRDEREFQVFWEYIRQNPVKAGLSVTPEEYPFFWQIYEV